MEFYQTPVEKAAALGESLIINHPFVDGNKRIALLAMVALLKEYNIELIAEQSDTYQFVMEMSMGLRKYEDIVKWIISNSYLATH